MHVFSPEIIQQIEAHLSDALPYPPSANSNKQVRATVKIESIEALFGGDSAEAAKLNCLIGRSGEPATAATSRSFFAKYQRDSAPLKSELDNLQTLNLCIPGHCPQALFLLEFNAGAILVLNYLQLSKLDTSEACLNGSYLSNSHISNSHQGDKALNKHSEKLQQEQLAELILKLHSHKSTLYGWPKDNYCGQGQQFNGQSDNWAQFWWQQRLLPQWQLADRRGLLASLAPLEAPLKQACESLLGKHQPEASLLHGDLWSGNAAFSDGRPVIFDPACYYGDVEAELAMCRLFGGFSEAFYRRYFKQKSRPGWQQRLALYQLYHLFNHLTIFGGSYENQCRRCIEQVIQDAGI
ncbi:fructosamine kinase family protein [Agaribacterium haliotis]|uniref:fructosamine kinase family protein n=1 Tax=Agaribacterium haliotis TaxID=2013869 RepID=UPI001177972D|nr:fructosamine kinase family protein [Agaribacterium haliotis]